MKSFMKEAGFEDPSCKVVFTLPYKLMMESFNRPGHHHHHAKGSTQEQGHDEHHHHHHHHEEATGETKEHQHAHGEHHHHHEEATGETKEHTHGTEEGAGDNPDHKHIQPYHKEGEDFKVMMCIGTT
eukprot:TRINITY_DN7859_c0_g1_i1.p1 TRINITY_DN7859_c0_g1~~TRINITY_DN7859_c0_g1_i1.p1  ORF type:complete len:127 (-),score=29.12 TRINITY_DN7859_c0_g1_i1:119-499(-)